MLPKSETLKFIHTVIPNKYVRRLFFVALWTVIGLLSATHWLYFPSGDYPYTWWELVRAKIMVWWLWGLFVFPILKLASKYKIDSPKIPQSLLILFGWSVLITIVYLICYTGIILTNFSIIHLSLNPLNMKNWKDMLDFIFRAHSTYYYLAFWLVVAVEFAFAYHFQYNERKINASRLQSQLVQAQLENLKSQLQPHFLFNSFNTISSLILDNKKDEAAELIAQLSDLLRLSLQHSSQQYVTLDNELDFLHKYLALIKARFANRLKVSTNIDNSSRQALVPALLLQPLVENAVKHGTGLYQGKSEISISSTCDNNTLTLIISNQLIDHENKTDLPTPTGFGIGLKNTEKRLQHLFDTRYTLNKYSESDNDYKVSIIIPYMKATDPVNDYD